ncbi:MAG: hypothetical protein QM534_10915 [Sediminibacterium sp.]|nr:hypothetical protein [Sediminibacterium sp.]
MKKAAALLIIAGGLLIACSPSQQTPSPDKSFDLKEVGLSGITLPGNSICEYKTSYEKYEVLLNDGIQGIRDINAGFKLSNDSTEAATVLQLFEKLNDADGATVEALKASLNTQGVKVIEKLEFPNGFKGVLVEEQSEGRKTGATNVDTSYSLGAIKNGKYYFIKNAGHDGSRYFNEIKKAIQSIH